MANDNVSGIDRRDGPRPVARDRGATTLSYRFLFIPGTIGSLTWLSRNADGLARIRHGLTLAGIGDRGSHTYKRTGVTRRRRSTASWRWPCADAGDRSRSGRSRRGATTSASSLPPGFRLPVGLLMRTPHGTYPEYHTSADDLDFIKPPHLADSVGLLRSHRGRSSNATGPMREPGAVRRAAARPAPAVPAWSAGVSGVALNELAILWVSTRPTGDGSSTSRNGADCRSSRWPTPRTRWPRPACSRRRHDGRHPSGRVPAAPSGRRRAGASGRPVVAAGHRRTRRGSPGHRHLWQTGRYERPMRRGPTGVPVKVVLFCGGQGLRLREYTEAIPKPMVPIGYPPILWHVMRYYAHFGHTDFVLCLGYRARRDQGLLPRYNEAISNDFVLSRAAAQIELLSTDIDDWRITFADTGLTPRSASGCAPCGSYLDDDEMFLANYGDTLTDAPLDDADRRLRGERQGGGFLAVRADVHASTSSTPTTTATCRASSTSRTPTRWINGGYFIFRPRDLRLHPRGRGARRGAVPAPDRRGQLWPIRYDGFWAPMDTLKDKQRPRRRWDQGMPPWAVWRTDVEAP